MSGLSDLKVKIKNQPHNLAWINDKERSVLKAMGGSGKAGPMGIPAYFDDSYGQDDPDGLPDLGPNEDFGFPDEPFGPDPDGNKNGYSYSDDEGGPSGDVSDLKTAAEMGLETVAPPKAPPSIEDKVEEYEKAQTLVGNIAATLHQRTLEGDTSPINPDMTLEEAKKAAADMGEGLISELEKKEQRGTITEREAGWLEDLVAKKEKAEREIGFINRMLEQAKAGKDTVISKPEWDPVMDGPRQLGGTISLEGPGAWQTYIDSLGKGLQGVVGDIGTGIGGLASAASMGSPTAILGALLTGKLESNPITAGLAGVPYESPFGLDKPFGDIFSLGGLLGDGGQKELSDLSKDVGKSTKDTLAEVADFYQISTKDVTKDHIESYHKNTKSDKRAGGGQVYNNFITRNEGGPVEEEEEKPPSAMELYLEKLGKPSKYTIPPVSLDTPSMAPPPAGSDPFELAEYRKGLARETMGNYLPFDVGGASGALNTFNEDYYGGASNVSPYNMAQLASILGLRGPGSYEGIIGMLGGRRNEPPPPPEPEPEPEPPVIPDDPYDDEGGPDEDGYKHGGGIGHILRRQAGGPAQAMMLADPNYRRYPHPGIGQSPPRGPDGKIISDRPWPEPPWPPRPEPPWPPRPEPPIPEPPVVDPPPPPTYDPVREEEARKRARELQAFKIGELDATPQTTAERLALEKSGGMYKDEHGEIRDASGAMQEDWGFDYTPPPELDKKYDPPNTPDTPPPVDPSDPTQPIDPLPLPPDVIDPLPPGLDPDRPVFWPYQPPGPHDPRVGIHYDYIQDHGPLNIPGSPNLGQGLQGLQQSQINYMGSPQFGQGLQGLQQGFGMQSPRPFGTPAFSSGFGGFGQQQGYNR